MGTFTVICIIQYFKLYSFHKENRCNKYSADQGVENTYFSHNDPGMFVNPSEEIIYQLQNTTQKIQKIYLNCHKRERKLEKVNKTLSK